MNPHDFLRYETACFNSVTPTSKHIIISPKAESKQVTFVYHKWQNGNSDFSLLLRNQFGLRFKPVSKKKKKSTHYGITFTFPPSTPVYKL